MQDGVLETPVRDGTRQGPPGTNSAHLPHHGLALWTVVTVWFHQTLIILGNWRCQTLTSACLLHVPRYQTCLCLHVLHPQDPPSDQVLGQAPFAW